LTFGDEDLINMDAAYFSGMPGGLMEMVTACVDKDSDATPSRPSVRPVFSLSCSHFLRQPTVAIDTLVTTRDDPEFFVSVMMFGNGQPHPDEPRTTSVLDRHNHGTQGNEWRVAASCPFPRMSLKGEYWECHID
jgi:hypothetical protein